MTSVNHKRFKEIRDNDLPLAQGKPVAKKDFAGQITIDFDSDGDLQPHQ